MSGGNDSAPAPAKPFRFKDETHTQDATDGSSDGRERKRKRRHHHRSHRSERSSHRRSKRSRHDEGDQYTRELNSDDAFRESLFDAMGDDEGATFWEGVYGQPIHDYPNQFVNEDTGELETMDDEEYATYVRRKMWEKSREGIEAAREEKREERARREAEEEVEEDRRRSRKERKPESSGEPHNNFVFDFEIEASLRRGQQRKDQKRWRELWSNYIKRWDDLQSIAETRDPNKPNENLYLRNKIAWPVVSGQRKDTNREEIERFMHNAAEAIQTDQEAPASSLSAILKAERVRWHPDKIQQRYGFMDVDELTIKGVTATFQVLDTMWNDLRKT